jgi:hypothetical protein
MSAAIERRLAALETRKRPLSADQAELARLPRDLSFAEIEAGQRALEAYGGDPVRAFEHADPVMTALVAAGRARRQGTKIGPLF